MYKPELVVLNLPTSKACVEFLHFILLRSILFEAEVIYHRKNGTFEQQT